MNNHEQAQVKCLIVLIHCLWINLTPLISLELLLIYFIMSKENSNLYA